MGRTAQIRGTASEEATRAYPILAAAGPYLLVAEDRSWGLKDGEHFPANQLGYRCHCIPINQNDHRSSLHSNYSHAYSKTTLNRSLFSPLPPSTCPLTKISTLITPRKPSNLFNLIFLFPRFFVRSLTEHGVWVDSLCFHKRNLLLPLPLLHLNLASFVRWVFGGAHLGFGAGYKTAAVRASAVADVVT